MNTTISNRNPENDLAVPEIDLAAAIASSLEQRPGAAVPEGFALRVVASLPPQPARHCSQSAGRAIAMVAAVLLAVAVFALAPHMTPSFASLAFDVELILLLQFGAITYFLAPPHKF